MNELKFNSQVCTTVEQSKKLLELGLKPETADCHYPEIGINNYGNFIVPTEPHYKSLPAWSLHRLLCLYGQDYTFKEIYNNAEECYGMLISAIGIAIENGLFNKEYLNE